MTSILFDEYYKLKDVYENNIKAQRFDILKQKNVTEQDIRKKTDETETEVCQLPKGRRNHLFI